MDWECGCAGRERAGVFTLPFFCFQTMKYTQTVSGVTDMGAEPHVAQERLSLEDELVVDAYCALVARVAHRLWREAQAALTPDAGVVYSVQPET